ncbi:choline-binding protein [Paenibacillus larvae subsp. larvae]|uniref:Choline-binding protein n=1 Tax=Paenibacillus larvae subsp. larvae TaxID=147375 RepID=A0A2L1UIK4_9BACL|nr:glycine betaine ABC transporter substrate-binding protein [Paenibacillus larvae]AQT84530.1 osmoprotectant ABC transporter substrate-binding protein [Paenibacillus larvae subsp. pulvifaciens]AQZ46527.1 osmoprotectant ABC transporter substrate-binding protein [Paenibacillus larvae subsp. pulvifaciens]AVF28241.1 choline-binding protein [Paenibacillus larvae subsp. larvae]AVF32744.1 choline-binding protein [Paenibacillus larvae subsp. larvae]MBH0341717.1 glycine/betaine ABC transporter substrat
MKKIIKRTSLLVIVSALVMTITGCGKSDRIIIGTQTSSEPKILASMYKLLIEDRTDLKVDVLPDLASSPVVISAMKKGEIQMATLYTGEIFNNYFPVKETKDRGEVLKQAQEGFKEHFNFKWFDPLGFENTYAFTVRSELAKENNLKTISDVKNMASKMTLGVDTTWLERENDGYPAFTKYYDIQFGQTLPMEIALVYNAVASKKVDIVLAYSTDARLKEYNLQTLVDDKQFFPPYDASPVIKQEVLDAHPEIAEVIDELIGKIDAETMINLNYEVDVNKRNEKKVAEEYLKKIGLL